VWKEARKHAHGIRDEKRSRFVQGFFVGRNLKSEQILTQISKTRAAILKTYRDKYICLYRSCSFFPPANLPLQSRQKKNFSRSSLFETHEYRNFTGKFFQFKGAIIFGVPVFPFLVERVCARTYWIMARTEGGRVRQVGLGDNDDFSGTIAFR
jgi:hypothetical protein